MSKNGTISHSAYNKEKPEFSENITNPSGKIGLGFFVWFIVIDFTILNASFFICNYLKRETFHLSPIYLKLLFMCYACWVVVLYLSDKIRLCRYAGYKEAAAEFVRSGLYLSYCIVFILVMFGLAEYSRVQVFSTCALFSCMECIVWLGVRRLIEKTAPQEEKTQVERPTDLKTGISGFLVGMDLLLLILSFFVVNYYKRGNFKLPPEYDKLLLILIGLWFAVSFLTQKFKVKDKKNFFFILWQWLKSGILMLATTSVIVFGLRLFYYSRLQGFGTIVLLLLLEIFVLSLYYIVILQKNNHSDVESVEDVQRALSQKMIDLDVDVEAIRKKLLAPARSKLAFRLEKNYSGVYEFIDEFIDIDEIMSLETVVENTCEPFALNSDRTPVRLFLNLHKSNDIRRLNLYFLQVHQMLLAGGYFVGQVHTIETHWEWIRNRYPRHLMNIVYFFDFIFNRIFPKTPYLKNLYFIVTKGKNRIISKAEYLGRLCFCGFEIVAIREIDKRWYVIARKIKNPSLNKNPSYGPLIKLERSGNYGFPTVIYKFRTMYPYSEYLQEYVYSINGLKEGGKLQKDFRVTAWGKIMRKFWLDELPMLYNWLKGDLQIVGVRPITFQYLDMYDRELKELRKQVKVGLIPPFYADLPTTFEEICDSEKTFIRSYLKSPIRTQLLYLGKVVSNIVFKGARSQ